MKSIINEEINDMMFQKQSRITNSKIDRNVEESSSQRNFDYPNELATANKRSVSPVEKIIPLDKESLMLKSFL